jgi:hypothetical protein
LLTPPRKPPKRPSKLAKSLDLSAAEESEIAEAWALFVDDPASEEAGEPAIVSGDVRKALMYVVTLAHRPRALNKQGAGP